MAYRFCVVGDGPADRAVVAAAVRLGLDVSVLVSAEDAPAARGGARVCVGDGRDAATLAAFCDGADLATSRDPGSLRSLEGVGVRVRPDPWTSSPAVGEGCHVVVVRSPEGQAVTYPPTQVLVEQGRLETLTPAPGLSATETSTMQHRALGAVAELGSLGAVEVWFAGGEVTACLPGPTSASLWSVWGAHTSVFDNHVRSLLDLPLGVPLLTAPHVVARTMTVGTEADPTGAMQHVLARDRAIHVTLHQSPGANGQALGEVVACDDDLDRARRRAHHAANYLMGHAELWRPEDVRG